MKRIHLIIHGHVQGVGFRYYCYEQATELGLTGYARNRRDGTVETEVQGEDESVDRYARVMSRGPHIAHVTEIIRQEMDVIEGEEGFGRGWG